jgi:hypothetical protein
MLYIRFQLMDRNVKYLLHVMTSASTSTSTSATKPHATVEMGWTGNSPKS